MGHPAGTEADFGKRLDAAMKKLFDYCLKQGVPIMAHTNHSNGAYKEFEDLAGSQIGRASCRERVYSSV